MTSSGDADDGVTEVLETFVRLNGILDVKKRAVEMVAPALPPAPMKPETTPSARREMNGTIP